MNKNFFIYTMAIRADPDTYKSVVVLNNTTKAYLQAHVASVNMFGVHNQRKHLKLLSGMVKSINTEMKTNSTVSTLTLTSELNAHVTASLPSGMEIMTTNLLLKYVRTPSSMETLTLTETLTVKLTENTSCKYTKLTQDKRIDVLVKWLGKSLKIVKKLNKKADKLNKKLIKMNKKLKTNKRSNSWFRF